MNETKSDITKTVISTLDINQRIGSLFPDSVILDLQFNIISICNTILDTTGYTTCELNHKSVSIFSTSSDFKLLLIDWLTTGYFEEQLCEIRCKNGETIPYSISGFYLGLIADMNGLIVLKFKNQQEILKIYNALTAKTIELDDFIYASSHSLRGPLATIKGLINLANNSKNEEEIHFLVKQMSVFAERLDEKLHHLIYVAESDKIQTSVSEAVSVQTICNSLSKNVHEASIDSPVNFYCPIEEQQQTLEKGELVFSLLNNLVLFFCQQPKREDNALTLNFLSNSGTTEIMMRSKGILICDSLIEKIKNVNFGYSEILNFPELINYYAAKKIMQKLNGTVQFMLVAPDEVVILMTVPREIQLSLF